MTQLKLLTAARLERLLFMLLNGFIQSPYRPQRMVRQKVYVHKILRKSLDGIDVRVDRAGRNVFLLNFVRNPAFDSFTANIRQRLNTRCMTNFQNPLMGRIDMLGGDSSGDHFGTELFQCLAERKE